LAIGKCHCRGRSSDRIEALEEGFARQEQNRVEGEAPSRLTVDILFISAALLSL
jgi:hypothetical protein